MHKHWKALLIELSLFLIVLADIALFWQSTFLSTGIAIVVVAYAMWTFHNREDIVFYCTGAVIGPLTEIICIKYGVWSYSNPVIFGIPLWLPILWGFAFLFARRLRDALFSLEHHRIHYLYHRHTPHLHAMLTYDLLLLSFLIFLTSTLFTQPSLLFITIGFTVILNLFFFHTQEDVFFVFFAGIVGPIMEVLSVYAGAWSYYGGTFFGIPPWLPVAYMLFAIIGRRMALLITNELFAPQSAKLTA